MAGTRKPRGRWYPYIFVGGFGVILAVNLVLLYFAVSTFSGLHVDDAYERGITYNDALAAARAQQELGWTAEVTMEAAGAAAGPESRTATLVVRVHDAHGRPLEGLDVRARLRRPTAQGFDSQHFLPHAGDGRYGATVDLPVPGQWQVDVVAFAGEVAYQTSERVVIP